jgi:hypothetical protein
LAGTVRITGLGRFADRITDRIARGADEREIHEIGQAIAKTSRRVETLIARDNFTPAQLTTQTRELRGWLAWLAQPERVAEYVDAVRRARTALEAAARAAAKDLPIHIEFRPSRPIYKMRTAGARMRITLPTPMIRFDEAAFSDLAALIFAHRPKGGVVERMCEEGYADLRTELEALGGLVEATRGRAHDLAESFDRVNARYFAGAMARPRLTWSRSMTRRKFGHYDHVRDWVMVSSTLDQPTVPAFVVDYLMYHELLHKKHGIRWVNGRGYAHTRAFYTDEAKFEGLVEAEGWLKKLATR